MLELEPYLHFDGTCEEALNFYKGIFGGEITSLERYAGSPMEAQVPDFYRDKVMHANFKAGSLKLMGSDGSPRGGGVGTRVSLSLGGDDPEEGKRIFDALAEGGKIDMPFQDTFWGAKFGMLTDKYGIYWMINIETRRD
jgi:PhnB protein